MILTLKNLWTRRKQHVWLCVELVLISVVSWFVIDPLFVEVYGGEPVFRDQLVPLF